MEPKFFVNLDTLKGASAQPLMQRLFSVLHGILRDNPGLFAVALPYMQMGPNRHVGHRARLFSESPENLQRALGMLAQYEGLQGHVRYGKISEVPADFEGAWVGYQRFRAPSRASSSEGLRERRLEEGQNLPFLRTVSKTNGHAFTIVVKKVATQKGLVCATDSYGLSGSIDVLALPDL